MRKGLNMLNARGLNGLVTGIKTITILTKTPIIITRLVRFTIVITITVIVPVLITPTTTTTTTTRHILHN